MVGRSPRRDERGAASLEFLIVVFPILMIFLAVVQLGLLGAARLVVAQAAARAARSAAVVVDDSPTRYGGEPAGQLDSAQPGPSAPSSEIAKLGLPELFSRGRSRLDTIRFAASLPIAALAPSMDEFFGWLGQAPLESVATAVGGGLLGRTMFGVLFYNYVALAVTPTLDGGDTVRVRVEYVYHCGVPLVSRLMCRSLPHGLEQLPAVPSQWSLLLLSFTQERFVRMTSEAAWPRQRFRGGAQNG